MNSELIRKGLNHVASSVTYQSEDRMITKLTEVPVFLRPMKLLAIRIQSNKESQQFGDSDNEERG